MTESQIPPGAKINEMLVEQLAALNHELFMEIIGPKESPLSKDYDLLSEEFKDVNRVFARNFLRRLGQIGYSLISRRSGMPSVVFSDSQIDLLAEIEHFRWMAQKVSMGWIYAPVRDNQLKQHPCLVPWELLGAELKDRDRAMVLHFIQALQERGLFSIIPLEPMAMKSDKTTLVFISASSIDYPHAEKVNSFLISQGAETFFSKESLPKLGSSDYRKKIDEALDESKHMIVVTSSARNVNSPWVEAEWGFFISKKRAGRKKGNIITVTIGSLQPHDLPPSLRYYEVIPMEPAALEKILAYIK